MTHQERIEWTFCYDETAKCCLRWKNHTRNPSYIGKECGTFAPSGYYTVSIKGYPYLAHRVIWQLLKGGISTTDTILFKDGDTTNCRIDNLKIIEGKDKNWQNEHLERGDWRKVFDLKDGELYWKGDRWSGKGLNKATVKDGDKLHTFPNFDGYMCARMENFHKKSYVFHRILYEWHHGEIPGGMCIDHINGDILDNRIENLRCVSLATNGRNIGIAKRNKTGVLGVRYREREDGNNSYIAFWNDENGKLRDRSFNCRKYGEEKAFQMAVVCRNEAIERLNSIYGEEAYHDNHGERISLKT